MSYLHNRQPNNKKKQITDISNNRDEFKKYYAKKRKSDAKEYIVHDCIYMKF